MADMVDGSLPRRILIVEDNEPQLTVLKSQLKIQGIDAVGCVTGEQALHECARNKFPVAILDLALPDMNGLQIISRLREKSPGCNVIIHTGYASLETALKAIHAGVFAYVEKTGDSTELFAQIHRAFEAYYSAQSDDLEREISRRTEELRASEGRYRALFLQAPEPILILDMDGIIVDCNRPATLGGYARGDIIGKHLSDLPLFDKGKSGEYAEFFEKVTRGNGPKHLKASVRTRNREQRWFEVYPSTITFHETSHVLLQVRDVTERLRGEQIMRAQRDLGLALLRAGSQADVSKLCADAVIELSGMDSVGMYLVNRDTGDMDLVFHRGLQDEFVQAVTHYKADTPSAQLVMKGEPLYTNHAALLASSDDIKRKEGLRALGILPVRHENTVVACLNVASHTLNEVPMESRVALETISYQIGSAIVRMRAETVLAESEAICRSLIMSSPMGMHVYDLMPDGSLVFDGGNPAADDILGVDHSRFKNMTIEEAFPALADTDIPKRYKDIAANGTMWRSEQIDYQDHRIMGAFEVCAFQTSPNKVAAVFQDVSERKKAEAERIELRQKLAEAERRESLGVMAGGVAHDLNNILGPIVLLPDMVEAVLRNPEGSSEKEFDDACEDLEAIKDSALRAAAAIKDLKALAGHGRLTLEPLEVNSLVRSCLDTRDIQALREEHPRIRFDSKLYAHDLVIAGSRNELHRVVLNLVINAMEAIHDRGKVTVETWPERITKSRIGYEVLNPGNYVVVRVRDTGEGIPDELLPRIFDPFVTSKKEAAGKTGSGLGLSVVHAALKDHHGYIDIETKKGKGTTFTLYFPMHTEMAAARDAELPEEPPTGKERILVVDDEPSQRFIATRGLRKFGYKVEEATNGHGAVEKVAEAQKDSKYDLIVLDMVMEEHFDGLVTLEHILDINPDQKVVIASGYAEDARARAAEDLGADWLPKPYKLNDLARAARKRLDRD